MIRPRGASSALRPAMAVAVIAGLAPLPAVAHGVAGSRFFPVTLTIDDPAVADEASVPSLVYQPAGSSRDYDFGFEWNKRLTETLGVGINETYHLIHQPAQAGGSHFGWDDPVLTVKYQVFENDAHEVLASVGLQKEFGGVGAINQGLAGSVGWTQPTVYLGKGMGDLPAGLGLLRPFAVTAEIGYQRSDEGTTSFPDGTRIATPNFLNLGAAVSYDLGYLSSQVKDFGLPDFANHLIPIVEFAYTTPASSQHGGMTTVGTMAPGFIYEAGSFQFGLEALVPATRASGNATGVIAQFHVYLDDLLPGSPLGRPLF